MNKQRTKKLMVSIVPKFRIDLSDLKGEGSGLIKELLTFLEEKANLKAETTANEIIVKGKEAISRKSLQTLIKDFLQKVGVKGKVKKGKGKNLIVTKSRVNQFSAEATANGRLSLNNAYKKKLKSCSSP